MQTRQLGATDLRLSTIGIGTWAMGGADWRFGWGAQDDQEAVRAIVHGVRAGINWIDTAAVYGNGHAEEVVGRALRELGSNERPLIATKCGRIIQSDGSVIGRLTRDSILAECAASRHRLGIDTIDLYQIHWPDPPDALEEAWDTLLDLKQQGIVRHIGVSNHHVEHMSRLQAIAPIASLQPPYSMIARDIEAQILPYCAQQHIGVIAYSPMGKGLLTGAFTAERAASLPENDHRSRDPKFQPPLLQINLQLVAGLEPIAQRNGRTLPELAIAWVLRRPEVTAAIVGARHPQQIDGVVAGADWALSSEDVAAIEALLEQRRLALEAVGNLPSGRV